MPLLQSSPAELPPVALAADADEPLDRRPEVIPSPRPLNIVHVITRLPLGGAEENTVATCLHQAASGHRVTLVHGGQAHQSWHDRVAGRVRLMSVESIKHPLSATSDLRAVRDLRRLCRTLAPDVVHTHESKAGIVGRVAASLARVPLVVHTIHIAPFLGVDGIRRRLYLAAEKLCANRSHLLIAVSKGMQQAYLSAGIGDRTAIPVIHSGMPLDRFAAGAAPADWRNRIGGWTGPKPRFILKLAAFEERKRHLQLLRAMAPVLRAKPDACLLLAGEGCERTLCEAEAKALGIDGQVRFLGHDHAPWELVALADICAHASEREGLPRSAVQAIAGGKPLVVAHLAGIEEIITDGVNGIVTGADDLDALARAVADLLDDPERLAKLQQGARSTDVSSWREEAMGTRIDQAYRRAAERRPPVTAIEFFGLPGAGKTTIARALLPLLRERMAPVRFSADMMGDRLGIARRSLKRLALIGAAFVRRPSASLIGLRTLIAHPRGVRDSAKTLWNYWSVLALAVRASKEDALLVEDQGLAQAIWSARVHHGSDGSTATSLFRDFDEWLGGTLFIQVDSAAVVAQRRLTDRGRRTSRFQDPGRIGDASLWSEGETIVAELTDQLSDELGGRGLAGRLLQIRTDENESAAQLAARIRDHLFRLDAVAPGMGRG